MDSVKGKVALVTGAAKGIGNAIARILVQNGAKVCLADIEKEKGEEAMRSLHQEYGQDSTIFVKCDVTSDADLINVFTKTKEKFGQLDMVCNIAGILHETQWRKCVDINLTAVIHGTLLAIEHMGVDKGGNGGLVINISSIAGLAHYVRARFAPVYSATKTAVVSFTRSMAALEQSTKKGVRINCICPYATDTDFVRNITEEQVYGLAEMMETITSPPIEVSTVAEAFLSLVQDSSLNGAILKVTPSGREFVE